MKIFIDTANVSEIEQAAAMGIVAGVTTNPSLIAKEKKDFQAVIAKIVAIVKGPVSAEVISTCYADMLKEARGLAKLADNIIIKVPLNAEGLKVVHTLSLEGIKTNVTLVFSANQALLAARAGASYVSPFVGRLDDIGQDGMQVVADIAAIFRQHCIATEIIAASIRHPLHVTQAALAGANIATIPYKVIMAMMEHPLTDIGIEKFLLDWKNANM